MAITPLTDTLNQGTIERMDIVDLSVRKQLPRIPKDIIKRLQRWIRYIETLGIVDTRKIPGLQ